MRDFIKSVKRISYIVLITAHATSYGVVRHYEYQPEKTYQEKVNILASSLREHRPLMKKSETVPIPKMKPEIDGYTLAAIKDMNDFIKRFR